MILAQTMTAATQSGGLSFETIGPLVTIVTILYAGWARIRAARLDALLRAAIVGVKAGLDSLDKTSAEIVKVEIEKAAGGKASDLNQDLKAEVRKTTSALKAYSEDPPAPPRLGAILLLAVLFLAVLFLGSGCISSAARDLAVTHEAHLRAFDGACVPHPSYTTDDAEPGPDGKKLTAAQKLAAWKAARAEVLESAHALAEALK